MDIHQHTAFLKKLSKSSPKAIKTLLKTATNEQLCAICECCLNVINRNCPINNLQLKQLKPYKKTLLNLVYKKGSAKSKRKILQQRGSGIFLPLLLPLALSYLAGKL